MKLFATALVATGYVHAMNDCGIMNRGEQCPDGDTAPHCGMDEVCISDGSDNPCSYSCRHKDSCPAGYKIWRSAAEESNNNGGIVEYVEYCAEKPYKSAYTCNLVDGVATVSATFLPITRSHPDIDNREYEFYHERFNAEEYEYGMFGQATSNCTDLLHKTIDDEGYTTFTFDLDGPNSVREACGLQFQDYTDKNNDDQKTHYQEFGFALGYENLMRRTPSGLALFQPGKHTNIECELVLSGDTVTGFEVGYKRDDEDLDDDIEVDFEMTLFEDRNFTDKYKETTPQFNLRVEQTEEQWIYIEVSSTSTAKYTHIEHCTLTPLDINEEPIPEHSAEDSKIIEEGCISRLYEDDGFQPLLWMDKMENPRVKGEKADRFGLQVYDVEGAASFKVECRLHACDYHNENEWCGLRENCPYENRYESIFGKNRARRSAGKDENVDTAEKSKDVSRTFKHPCQLFSGQPDLPMVCVSKDNCWLRAACNGRYKE